MKARNTIATLAALIALAVPQAAEAYIGPGAGLSVGGAVVGVFVTLLMAAAVIVLWPLRMVMRRLRRTRPSTAGDGVQDPPDGPNAPAP